MTPVTRELLIAFLLLCAITLGDSAVLASVETKFVPPFWFKAILGGIQMVLTTIAIHLLMVAK